MLNIYRTILGVQTTLSPTIISYTYSGEFMGDRSIKASLSLNAPFQFSVGDYVEHPVTSEKFYLNYIPTDKKTSTFTFTYELTFVPAQRELGHCDFLDVVLAGNNEYYTGGSTVEFYGDLVQLRDRIQANLNRLYTGTEAWAVIIGNDPDTLAPYVTDYKDILLSDSKVWDAVSLCKSTFGLNFSVVGRTITLGYACSTPLGMPTFKYGKGKGLYEIARTVQDDTAVVTRLRVFGGSKNIPADYNRVENQEYHAELMLPGYSDVESPNYKKNYIDSANVSVYGIREGVYRNEDIYPSIVGITHDDLVAAGYDGVTLPLNTAVGRIDEIVDVSDILTEDQAEFNIWIKDLGFDPNTYLIPDETFTISMTTGRLAGVQFEITKCELSDPPVAGAVWKLTCNRNTDDTPIILPDALTNASAGDRFVLLNITLPQAYISASESRLLVDGQDQLAKIDVSKVVYSVGLDEIYMKKNPTVSVQVMEGILCPVIDAQLGINTSIIAQTVTVDYGESQAPTYQVTLSNEPVAGTIGGIQDEIENVRTESTANRLKSDAAARRSVHNLNRLKDSIFDTDGYFDGTNIRPNSIETMYLSVGAKSWDFMLFADIKSNYGGNYDDLVLYSGTLVHREIYWGSTTDDANYTWSFSEKTFITGINPLADPLAQYYIYIKGSKDNGTAEWFVSEAQMSADGTDGYYFFVGILYPSIDSAGGTAHARSESITYGKTWINGRFITTGVIQSADESCKIDLDLNQILFSNGTNGFFWNRNNDGKVVIVGGLVQSSADSEAVPIGAFRGAYSASISYLVGDQVTYNGSSYRCTAVSTGNDPTNLSYWTVVSAKGEDGTSVKITGNVATSGDLPVLWDAATTYYAGDEVIYLGKIYGSESTNTDKNPVTWFGMYWLARVNPETGDQYEVASGDGLIAQDTGDLWVWDGSSWSDVGQIKGDTGIGISSVTLMYLVSTLSTGINVAGNTWSDTAPTMTPTNKYLWSYQNITYTDTSSVNSAPAVIGVYGDKGLTGETGNYFEHRYKSNGSPTVAPTIVNSDAEPPGWELTIPSISIAEYCWITTAEKTSAGVLVGIWSSPSRLSGVVGNVGPSSLYLGVWSALTEYIGSETIVQAVYYSGAYYITRSDAGVITAGTAPTESAYWNPYEATFESIATGTLLAQGANIAEFIFLDGNMISQHGTISGVDSTDYTNENFIPNLTLNGSTGEVIANNATIRGNLESGTIGGFTIVSGRIGVPDSNSGMTISGSLIKYSKSAGDPGNSEGATLWAGIGANVSPPSLGNVGLARLEYSDTDTYGTPGYALKTKFRPGTVDIYNHGAENSIINDGNVWSVGGHCICDDTYIGAATSSSLIGYHIGITHQFMITSITSGGIVLNLPSSSVITSAGIRAGTTFLLQITLAITCSDFIRLTSVTGGQIYNNNGQTVAYLDLRGTDTIMLRYYNGCYYIVSILQ